MLLFAAWHVLFAAWHAELATVFYEKALRATINMDNAVAVVAGAVVWGAQRLAA
jgi:hypothetical protein